MAPLKIFLSAGEASGDHYGAMLIAALDRLAPGTGFFGLGGPRMLDGGLRCVVKAEDVAVMGITEVVAHMPRIYSRYCRLKASLRREKPDLAILVDFPDVNLRLARQLRRLGVPVVYFVSPQLWAWKKWRIRSIQRFVNRMLVIFPFEEEFYRRQGVAADFVGHPLADLPPPVGREAFASENGLEASKTWIGLLPGSRRREIKANLPPMLQAARLLGPSYQFLLPAAPTLEDSVVREMLNEALKGCAGEDAGGPELSIAVVHDAHAVLQHSRASIVASGTATVAAALAGNPFVVVYRVSALSYAVARRVVSVPHIAMVNLIAGRGIVPELIQSDFTGSNVARHLRPLLEDGPARATMQSDLESVRGMLRGSFIVEDPDAAAGSLGADTAIGRAASIALELLQQTAAGDRGPNPCIHLKNAKSNDA